MAEQSIRIADSGSGLRLAMTQAAELDDGGNPRVMERVTFGSGKMVSPIGNALRGNVSMISAADTLDLTALPSDLTNNLLTVGDKSMLIVIAEQTRDLGTVTVTPICFDNEGALGIFTLLEPKLFSQPFAFRRGSGAGNYLSPIQRWDVSGAYRIGLHISAISGTIPSNTVRLWGRVI